MKFLIVYLLYLLKAYNQTTIKVSCNDVFTLKLVEPAWYHMDGDNHTIKLIVPLGFLKSKDQYFSFENS